MGRSSRADDRASGGVVVVVARMLLLPPPPLPPRPPRGVGRVPWGGRGRAPRGGGPCRPTGGGTGAVCAVAIHLRCISSAVCLVYGVVVLHPLRGPQQGQARRGGRGGGEDSRLGADKRKTRDAVGVVSITVFPRGRVAPWGGPGGEAGANHARGQDRSEVGLLRSRTIGGKTRVAIGVVGIAVFPLGCVAPWRGPGGKA